MKKFLLGLLNAIIVIVSLAIAGFYLLKVFVESVEETYDAKNYQVYIEDGVRYTLASAHPKYAYIDFDNSELQSKTDTKIDKIASSIEDVDKPGYKIALEKLIKEGSPFEKKYSAGLLDIYNSLKLDFSPYQRDKEKNYNYTFQEKNSRVRFTVSVGSLAMINADIWDLDRYTKYLETGKFEDAPDKEVYSDPHFLTGYTFS